MSSENAVLAAWLALPEGQRAECIDNKILYYAMPGPKHGEAQGLLFAALRPYHGKRTGPAGLGGWWLSMEVDLELDGFGCRPDLVGWKRIYHPHRPQPDARGLVTAVPNWIAEVLSTSTASVDMGKKRQAYFLAGVEHYWIVDPQNQVVSVYQREENGYVLTVAAGRGETIQAEPFLSVTLHLDEFFEEE
jgi:Uma2 family endonuclease